MTDNSNHRPLCMWVQDRENASGTFQENPQKALKDNENHLRCTKHSDIAFVDNDVVFYACRYHAPEEFLEDLNIPVPKDRHRKGRISV